MKELKKVTLGFRQVSRKTLQNRFSKSEIKCTLYDSQGRIISSNEMIWPKLFSTETLEIKTVKGLWREKPQIKIFFRTLQETNINAVEVKFVLDDKIWATFQSPNLGLFLWSQDTFDLTLDLGSQWNGR